jgi:ABC-type Fe3+-siderophore transport system permease subunit
MTPLFIKLARIVSVAFGLLLILLSVVLYETEEGNIQNKLEEWWVVLCETESRAVKKHAAFVAGVAGLAGRVFDRLFGQKLFSPRSLGVSACFSLASLGLVCARGLSSE